MSDGWAVKYIAVHKQKQQEQQNRQKRAQLAEAGAPCVFQKIMDRIRRDLQTFHDAGVLLSLKEPQNTPEGKFRVAVVEATRQAGLEMQLDLMLIQYDYGFSRENGRLENRHGTLRVSADSEGVMTVYRNEEGVEKAFFDESGISEFLLQPLLDFIDA